jgi:hypothetical protein
MFAGSSNSQYKKYMLELYCLFKYEASKDLKDAIWNNWLVNLSSEVGKYIERDLLQEHYNKWQEDMVKKHGGRFDDKFYRSTISPNVQHILNIKEAFESAFELSRRTKGHTSPHLSPEYQTLLVMYVAEQLHYFRSGRSMGHCANNYMDAGYNDLEKSIHGFLKKTLADADMIIAILEQRKRDMNSAQSTAANTTSVPEPVTEEAPADPPSLPQPAQEASLEGADASSEVSSQHSSHSSTDNDSISRDDDDATEDDSETVDGDHDDHSGLDMAVSIDAETGSLIDDWCDDEELAERFEADVEQEPDVETPDMMLSDNDEYWD